MYPACVALKLQAPDIPTSKQTGPGPMLAPPHAHAGQLAGGGDSAGSGQFPTTTASGGQTEKFATPPATTCQVTDTWLQFGNDNPSERFELVSV
ncbi:MAG: hypothetical protein WB947_03265 [Thermoplasmata archaeon]